MISLGIEMYFACPVLAARQRTHPKRFILGNMDGKMRKRRTANTWFQDLKDWAMLDTMDMMAASQLAVDRNIT